MCYEVLIPFKVHDPQGCRKLEVSPDRHLVPNVEEHVAEVISNKRVIFVCLAEIGWPEFSDREIRTGVSGSCY